MQRSATTTSTVTLLLLTAALSPPALADEIRLADGRVVVGDVERAGKQLVITTRTGVVRVAESDVVSWRDDEELRAELESLAAGRGDTAFNHLQLAETALSFGLEAEMWEHLDRAVARAAQAGEGIRTRLRGFLGELEPELIPRHLRPSSTGQRVRALLRNLRDAGPARRQAVVELLVREPEAVEELRKWARAAVRAEQRIAVLEALNRRKEKGVETFVYRTAILDRQPTVRAAAMDLARETGRAADAVDYLSPGLLYPDPVVSTRTAAAFSRLGHLDAVPHLISAGIKTGRALANGGPGSVRGHVAFIEQTAFVKDFEVDVAQASFIADPQVDVIQSGMVLDATVHAVQTQRVRILRAFRKAVGNLAGEDPGRRTSRWDEWWEERQKELADTTGPKTGNDR